MIMQAALDTSEGFSFALARGNDVMLSCTEKITGRESDRRLMPLILEKLAAAGLTVEDIRKWTVGTGPGSFAGLRVGISLVKGCCMASGAELRGVPTSFAVAAAVADSTPEGQKIAVLNDARRKHIILSEYKKAGGVLLPCSSPAIVDPVEIQNRRGEWQTIITAQADRIESLLPASVKADAVFLDAVDAANYFRHAAWPETAAASEETLEPVYVRPPVFVPPAPIRKV